RMSENFFIEKFSITNTKVMNQVSDRLENYHYSIVLSSNNIIQSSTIKNVLTKNESNKEKMSSFYNMDQQMKYIKSNLDTYETEIVLNGINGVNYTTNRSYFPVSDEELQNSIVRKNTLQSPRKILYQSFPLQGATSDTKDKNYIIASKALMDPLSEYIYGSMFFVISEREFRKFYTNYTTDGNNVYIMNGSGIILSSNESKYIGKTQPEFKQYAERLKESNTSFTIESFKGKDQIVLLSYIPSFDMYLINLIDKEKAIGDLLNKKQIFLLCLEIVIIVLIVVFFISRLITKPLSILVKEISNTSKNEFHRYIDVKGIYETREIGNAFNLMLDELHEYVDKLLISQKKQRNAELEALQQQINPHFLYNTLTSIKFIVMQGDKKEAEMVINAFISLLQNTIGNVSELITAKQEVENLKNYVFIKQKRYGSRINVHYFIDPQCSELLIPKLVLQPFVENAFFHAFNIKENGYIHILIWKEKGQLICEVIDNGDGFKIEDSDTLPSTKRNQQLFKGIGIRNVDERIKLLYGESYGAAITSQLGEGTKVRLTLPIIRNE
ncbi:MAG TPA: sensor histidine kinase, partial [Niallia sp.]|nr:sensor histidine kinase [Niallia sp.]